MTFEEQHKLSSRQFTETIKGVTYQYLLLPNVYMPGSKNPNLWHIWKITEAGPVELDWVLRSLGRARHHVRDPDGIARRVRNFLLDDGEEWK